MTSSEPMTNLKNNGEQVQPLITYTDLCTNKFALSDADDVSYWPHKLCQVNNTIWCAGWKPDNFGQGHITVHDGQCGKVKTITDLKLTYIVGLCLVPPKHQVIVACINQDLHQLDTSGQYQTRLAIGQFADVCYDNGRLYALDCTDKLNAKIRVFKYNSTWQLEKTLSLNYTDGHDYDSLCVRGEVAYVSSSSHRCIYVYNMEGQEEQQAQGVQQIEQRAQLVQQISKSDQDITLCGIDETGTMLVCNRVDRQIQLYDKEHGWRVVSVTTEIDNPKFVIVDSQRDMWVATLKTLLKYIQTVSS